MNINSWIPPILMSPYPHQGSQGESKTFWHQRSASKAFADFFAVVFSAFGFFPRAWWTSVSGHLPSPRMSGPPHSPRLGKWSAQHWTTHLAVAAGLSDPYHLCWSSPLPVASCHGGTKGCYAGRGRHRPGDQRIHKASPKRHSTSAPTTGMPGMCW